MITIHPDYSTLFSSFRDIDDFLNIDIDIVRDFKNRKTGRFEIDGKGFSLVEVLSMCPTDWKLSTSKSVDFVNNEMKETFPLGVYKDKS